MTTFVSATDRAIYEAHQEGHLELLQRTGRFGPYIAIADRHGVIEVADDWEAVDVRLEQAGVAR